MQLLEHQAKDLLKNVGIAIPSGILAHNVSDIDPSDLTFPVVIKSQVPIGGRGKLGGVRLVTSIDDFPATFSEVKVLEIKGYTPESILIEDAIDIDRELYLALRLNRDARRIDVIASSNGGVEIESQTSSIVSMPYDQISYDDISATLGVKSNDIKPLIEALYECMVSNDLLLLEVNPLVVTTDNALIAADAKCLLDDNALFKHSDYANQAVSSSVMPLGGTIGVIANGAGMAMSTMDTIYAAGGKPANFLDIGGGTGEDVFIKYLREITTIPGITSIIINIFAGITRCDDIARGIIAAQSQISDLVPLYIRLEGTRKDEAAKLLDQAGIRMETSLASCVQLAIGSTLEGDVSKAQPNATGAQPRKVAPEKEVPIAELFFNTPTIVQGITGHHGSFHAKGMRDAGTEIVAGITPGKGGQYVDGIRVYNTVKEAVNAHQATASVIFVPPAFAKAAMIEAIDAGITLIVCITEGIPVHDMLAVQQYAQQKHVTILGPNCPGLIVPGSHKLGIIAAHITTPGSAAIISRSGTLTYELADALTKKGIGQRIVLGIGGDPVQGMSFTEALALCEADPEIDQIIMVGEIGGTSEQQAADYIKEQVSKPVHGLVVGHSLPAGQQFGHAGAIVGGLGESAKEKTEYMANHGIIMSQTLDNLITSLSQD
ncbi:MAG: succinate--CoA ligase subunit alpha [Candidatus Saccharimonadales bacterium]